MSTAIATTEIPQQPGMRAMVLRETLEYENEQRAILNEYVKHHMVSGTDYGIIPGTKNNTLLKPGAEKLTELFRCTPNFVQTNKIEDWDRPLFHYEFRCEIVSRDAGTLLAVGVGSCNSREKKYRWRDEGRKCPNCGKETIIKGKEEFGGGWLCYFKKGGCGAKFNDGAQAIEGQVVGRVENPDVFDCINSILKIAKKRALVDAAIALARCSDIFTQDIEDFHHDDHGTPPARPLQQQPPRQTQAVARPDKVEFDALMKRKGWNWGGALRSIDRTNGTAYLERKSGFDAVDAAHLNSFAEWLKQRPDAAAPASSQPATAPPQPAADTPDSVFTLLEGWSFKTDSNTTESLMDLFRELKIDAPSIDDLTGPQLSQVANALRAKLSE